MASNEGIATRTAREGDSERARDLFDHRQPSVSLERGTLGSPGRRGSCSPTDSSRTARNDSFRVHPRSHRFCPYSVLTPDDRRRRMRWIAAAGGPEWPIVVERIVPGRRLRVGPIGSGRIGTWVCVAQVEQSRGAVEGWEHDGRGVLWRLVSVGAPGRSTDSPFHNERTEPLRFFQRCSRQLFLARIHLPLAYLRWN